MAFFSGDMVAAIPVYVTRTDADGETGTLSMSIWMQLVVLLLAWLNAVGWSIYGLVELVSKLI